LIRLRTAPIEHQSFRSATTGVSSWLSGCFQLVKFRYHITFSNVVAGALLFASELNWMLAERLVALYLSFNVLLYSGLYTLNDLVDRDSDAAHPLKRHRPIASGRVTIRRAIVWTVVFLTAGLGTGALFGVPIVSCYLAIIAVNLAYSGGGRNVVYLDVLLNGLPHVVRFLLGALLVMRRPPLTHLIAFLFVTMAFSCLRRRIEIDVAGWEARQSLQAWSVAKLNGVMIGALVAFLLLAAWKGTEAPGFYAVIGGTAAVLIGGAHTSRRIRRCLRWVWTQ
jgi:4-hydroxybenzoate polyprenyltransferase